MNRKIFPRNVARVLGLLAFIATGGGLLISTALNGENFYKTEILLIFGGLFAISLIDHFTTLIRRDDDESK